MESNFRISLPGNILQIEEKSNIDINEFNGWRDFREAIYSRVSDIASSIFSIIEKTKQIVDTCKEIAKVSYQIFFVNAKQNLINVLPLIINYGVNEWIYRSLGNSNTSLILRGLMISFIGSLVYFQHVEINIIQTKEKNSHPLPSRKIKVLYYCIANVMIITGISMVAYASLSAYFNYNAIQQNVISRDDFLIPKVIINKIKLCPEGINLWNSANRAENATIKIEYARGDKFYYSLYKPENNTIWVNPELDQSVTFKTVLKDLSLIVVKDQQRNERWSEKCVSKDQYVHRQAFMYFHAELLQSATVNECVKMTKTWNSNDSAIPFDIWSKINERINIVATMDDLFSKFSKAEAFQKATHIVFDELLSTNKLDPGFEDLDMEWKKIYNKCYCKQNFVFKDCI